MLSLILILLSTTVTAQSKLSQALYYHLEKKQIEGALNSRHDGAWYTHAYFEGHNRLVGTNSFTTLQILMSLDASSKYVRLDGLAGLHHKVQGLIEKYLEDAKLTQEPAGTLNFWALYRMPFGRYVHFQAIPKLAYAVQKYWDIPNELDTSSQLYLWAKSRELFLNYQNDYLNEVGRWVDLQRPVQHPVEDNWKDINSGAFLTWTENRTGNKSRLPHSANDVDCVVNLNVLHSLSEAEEQMALPSQAKTAKNNACQLMRQLVSQSHYSNCSLYYDRTHVLYSAAKHFAKGVACLQPVKRFLQKAVWEEAEHVLSYESRSDAMDYGEIILALKWLFPIQTRTQSINKLIQRVVTKLEKQISWKGPQAMLPAGFIYRGTNSLGMTGGFYSSAMTSALALEALVTP